MSELQSNPVGKNCVALRYWEQHGRSLTPSRSLLLRCHVPKRDQFSCEVSRSYTQESYLFYTHVALTFGKAVVTLPLTYRLLAHFKDRWCGDHTTQSQTHWNFELRSSALSWAALKGVQAPGSVWTRHIGTGTVGTPDATSRM